MGVAKEFKIRKGNDVKMQWPIVLSDGTPEDFTNAEHIKLEVVYKRTGERQVQDYDITDNVVSFQYVVAEHIGPGKYDTVLSYQKQDASVEGGVASYTVDIVNAFELVEHSCEQSDVDELILDGRLVFAAPDSVSDNAPDLLQQYRISKL